MEAYMICAFGCGCAATYNPDTCNNGGGYLQPSGGIVVALEDGNHLTVTVEDMSCGDFGSRVFWAVESTDGRSWGGCYGSMDDASIDNAWSDASIDSVSGCYGINAWAMICDAVDAAHIIAR